MSNAFREAFDKVKPDTDKMLAEHFARPDSKAVSEAEDDMTEAMERALETVMCMAMKDWSKEMQPMINRIASDIQGLVKENTNLIAHSVEQDAEIKGLREQVAEMKVKPWTDEKQALEDLYEG